MLTRWWVVMKVQVECSVKITYSLTPASPMSGWWVWPIANSCTGCNEFISCRLWKCSSPSHRHSDIVEAHKHKVQCVNPHCLDVFQPALYNFWASLYWGEEKRCKIPTCPLTRLHGPPYKVQYSLSLKTTCVVIFNLSGSCLFPWRKHVFLGYLRGANRSASVHNVLVVNIGRSKTAHCDLLWMLFHLRRVHFPWRL